ncbi:MAG: hypothetical protein IJ525_02950 [Alphaproteobacteria bacterium]|nr:hypothetical protein [Alphaproteobacteria bacterium]
MKNFEIKNIESGRSMIEMLGVLAIIGVLSVGGIAGYSKSMQKYRINKTIEQVSQISQNIRTFFAPQRDFSDLDSTTADGKKLVQKAKLIPDEMLGFNDDGTIKQINNTFGGTVEMGTITGLDWNNGYPTYARHSDNYYLYFDSVPQDACIDLITQNWLNVANLYAVSVNFSLRNIGGNSGNLGKNCSKGCSGFKSGNHYLACAGGSTYSLPIEVDKAIEFCSQSTNNSVGFLFY